MGRNWKMLADRRRKQRNAEIERQNSKEMVARRSLKPAEPGTEAELSVAIVERAKEARQLGEECRIILEAYGAHESQAWEAKQLRRLIRELRSQGDSHEAMAVERYADARVAWGQAINDLNAARNRPHPPQATPRGRGKAATPTRADGPVYVDPVTSQAIPARLVNGGGQAPVPGGLIGSAGVEASGTVSREWSPEAYAPSMRLIGKRAESPKSPPPFRWQSGWAGGTNPTLPVQTSRAIPPWEVGPAS